MKVALKNIFTNISIILSIFIYVLLFYFSLTETSVIDYDMNEYSYFVKDNILVNLFFLFLYIYIIYTISSYLYKFKVKHLYIFFMFTISISLIYLIGNVNLHPTWDSERVIEAAVGLKSHDYSMFTYGNYISQYPFQIPIVLYYYLLILIFGKNYIAFQFVNVIFLVLIYYYLIKISSLISCNKKITIITLLLCISFISLQVYVMFLYSNIPSLFFTCAGIYYFLNHYHVNPIRNMMLSFVFLLCATLLKGTAYILLIAEIILYILDFIQTKNIKRILIVIISTIFIILSPDIANKTVSSLDSSIDLKTSTYKEIALVMGTSYGPRGAGWHNGWYEPYLYKQYGTNTDAMRKDGIKRTINNLNTLVHDHKLLDFYHDKICSMYINPDYQGFWTISANKAQQFGKGNPQAQSFLWITYDKENDIYSHFTSSFMTGKVNQLIIFYENILMNVIYLGALCYILFNRKKMTTEKIFIPLIFIGCFLFFLLWEAKGQYSILFYILLFPLTAEGIEQLAKVIFNNRK